MTVRELYEWSKGYLQSINSCGIYDKDIYLVIDDDHTQLFRITGINVPAGPSMKQACVNFEILESSICDEVYKDSK